MTGARHICDASTGFRPALVSPAFKSPRDRLRWMVRHLNLSAFSREDRQAAAADPAIVWDASARQYRPRRKGDAPRFANLAQPVPGADPSATTPARPGEALDSVEGSGGIER